MERGNLIVQGGCDYSITTKPDIQTSEARLRAFALAKLEKYVCIIILLFYHAIHATYHFLYCTGNQNLSVLWTNNRT